MSSGNCVARRVFRIGSKKKELSCDITQISI
jgi:hypothetical protein